MITLRDDGGSGGTRGALSSDVRPTLADEHAVLRSETKTRADALLSAMSAGLWPAGELRALVEYFRVEVLQQAEAGRQVHAPQP